MLTTRRQKLLVECTIVAYMYHCQFVTDHVCKKTLAVRMTHVTGLLRSPTKPKDRAPRETNTRSRLQNGRRDVKTDKTVLRPCQASAQKFGQFVSEL